MSSLSNISVDQVIKTYGKPIKYARDCKPLAEEIERVTGRPISVATLRRFFGLMKSKSKLSNYSRETLYLYIKNENENFDQFNDFTAIDEDTISEVMEVLLEKYEEPNEALATYLLNAKLRSNITLEVLLRFIKISVEKNYTSFIIEIYKKPNYVLENCKIFRTLGITLLNFPEEAKGIIKELSRLSNGRRQFFERYINIDRFRDYYWWLNFFIKNETKPHAKMWGNSILILGNYLSGREVDPSELEKFLIENRDEVSNYHPYMTARIAGVLLLFKTSTSIATEIIEERLSFELNQLRQNPLFPPLFSVMVFQYVLLEKNRNLNLGKRIHRNFHTYNSNRVSHIDSGIAMLRKISSLFIGTNAHFVLDEVKNFDSGHTSQDVIVKYYASSLATDSYGKVVNYQRSLISESGFEKLPDFFEK